MLLFLLDSMVSRTVSKDSYHLPGGSGLSLDWQPYTSSFFSLDALSTPGWPMVPQPCSVSAPPETMSPLLTVLPFCVPPAGRSAASSHWPRSLNLLLEGQCSEAKREGDSPAQQTAVLTCPPLPATPSLPRSGVEPFPAAPLYPTSRHVLKTKSDRDECLAPPSSPTLAQALQPPHRCFPASVMPLPCLS